jgi:hypothetical protein
LGAAGLIGRDHLAVENGIGDGELKRVDGAWRKTL